jgi:hypothetical protein
MKRLVNNYKYQETVQKVGDTIKMNQICTFIRHLSQQMKERVMQYYTRIARLS